jgi:hypothetical protein
MLAGSPAAVRAIWCSTLEIAESSMASATAVFRVRRAVAQSSGIFHWRRPRQRLRNVVLVKDQRMRPRSG